MIRVDLVVRVCAACCEDDLAKHKGLCDSLMCVEIDRQFCEFKPCITMISSCQKLVSTSRMEWIPYIPYFFLQTPE